MAVMGSDEFITTRSTLAGNALDLGAWYGYQEVWLRKAKELSEVKFKFRIPENSYLDIFFSKEKMGLTGVRLSRSSAFASGYFSSDQGGRFLSYEAISVGDIGPGWHQIRLIFPEKGSILTLDHSDPIPLGPHHGLASGLGFRGGITGAEIDDVEAIDVQGVAFTDSFRNGREWLKLSAVHFALLAAIFGMVIWLALKTGRWPEAMVMNGGLVVAAQLFICLSLFHAFDFYFWSKLPLQTDMRLFSTGQPVPQMRAESGRAAFFSGWRKLLGREKDVFMEISSYYPPDRIFQGPIYCGSSGGACLSNAAYAPTSRKNSCARVLLLGASQSVGSGAYSLEQTFFVRLHRGLSKALPGRCVESLNLSVSGADLTELTDLFKKHLNFNADVVLVNFSSNGSGEGLYEKLARLVEVGHKIQAKIVFVAEANSPEAGENYGLMEKHRIMRQAGLDLGVETISMQDFLGGGEIRRSGQVWLDHVHLTTYGQSLVADWLQPKVLQILRRAPARRPVSIQP